MISLDVKEYCSDCLHFKPDAKKTAYYNGVGEVVYTDTVVQCEYQERCERLKACLELEKFGGSEDD